MPADDRAMVVPLEQLWTRLTAERQQEVLQRLTQMVVQRLVLPDDEGEASDE